MRPPDSLSSAPVRAEVQPGIWLDSRRALWLAPERLLVLADLHWGYAVSHRARGNLLPWWGDEEIAGRVVSLLADYHPAEMLWLGDIVHAAEGASAVERFLRTVAVPVTVLAGNHDRLWSGARERTTIRGRFFFHHGDATLAVPESSVEVVGHHHPAVAWSDGAGTHVKLPALVVSERRLVLPAFSPWAAGAPWKRSRESAEILWAIAPTRIFALPAIADIPSGVAV